MTSFDVVRELTIDVVSALLNRLTVRFMIFFRLGVLIGYDITPVEYLTLT